jgi:hypothetical protein
VFDPQQGEEVAVWHGRERRLADRLVEGPQVHDDCRLDVAEGNPEESQGQQYPREFNPAEFQPLKNGGLYVGSDPAVLAGGHAKYSRWQNTTDAA